MKDEFFKRMQENFQRGLDIVHKKNEDYSTGEDPFRNFRLVEATGICSVERGILVRMADKFQRICNLIDKPNSVPDETIEDTLIDLMNYANILLTYIQMTSPKRTK